MTDCFGYLCVYIYLCLTVWRALPGFITVIFPLCIAPAAAAGLTSFIFIDDDMVLGFLCVSGVFHPFISQVFPWPLSLALLWHVVINCPRFSFVYMCMRYMYVCENVLVSANGPHHVRAWFPLGTLFFSRSLLSTSTLHLPSVTIVWTGAACWSLCGLSSLSLSLLSSPFLPLESRTCKRKLCGFLLLFVKSFFLSFCQWLQQPVVFIHSAPERENSLLCLLWAAIVDGIPIPFYGRLPVLRCHFSTFPTSFSRLFELMSFMLQVCGASLLYVLFPRSFLYEFSLP